MTRKISAQDEGERSIFDILRLDMVYKKFTSVKMLVIKSILIQILNQHKIWRPLCAKKGHENFVWIISI